MNMNSWIFIAELMFSVDALSVDGWWSVEGHSICLFELSIWDFCSDLSISFRFDWYLLPGKCMHSKWKLNQIAPAYFNGTKYCIIWFYRDSKKVRMYPYSCHKVNLIINNMLRNSFTFVRRHNRMIICGLPEYRKVNATFLVVQWNLFWCCDWRGHCCRWTRRYLKYEKKKGEEKKRTKKMSFKYLKTIVSHRQANGFQLFIHSHNDTRGILELLRIVKTWILETINHYHLYTGSFKRWDFLFEKTNRMALYTIEFGGIPPKSKSEHPITFINK